MSKKRRQSDPYAEESTELEDNDAGIEPKLSTEQKDLKKKTEIKPCCHASRSVNLKNIKKSLIHGTIGACTICVKARTPLCFLSETGDANKDDDVPVIWMCAFCGQQGCDRRHHKHAFQHYLTPRSDLHYLAINTKEWTVWCYKCDNEVVITSCKKLDETLQYIRKTNEMAPKRATSSLLNPSKTNLTSQYSGSDSRLHLSSFSEESFRKKKITRIINMVDMPKAKGLMNLGNTCFFNSVMQNLSQTHYLTQLFETQLQNGQKVFLPGRSLSNYISFNSNSSDSYSEDDNIELKPMELYLSEGGPLSLSFSSFINDMYSVAKYSNTIKPDQLFGVLCKKSTQFEVLEQQDAHELLRCFLDGIRNEEIMRMKKAILKAFALSEKTNPLKVNEKLRKLIKGYGTQVTHTIIDEIFSGQLISTIICEQCGWSCQRFEPFMDLSLPIIEEKGRPKKNNFTEDEAIKNCHGRKSNVSMSKHQAKKIKNNKKRGKAIYAAKYSGKKSYQTKVIEERRNRRLTEKRLPEDDEDLLQKQEEEERIMGVKKKAVGCSKSESEKFKKLVQQKSLQSRQSDGESQEEEMEYDFEDDDDDSFGTVRHIHKKENCHSSKVTTPSYTEEEESITQESGEVEDETDENGNSLSEDSSRRCQYKETSDADVEDNNDSDNTNGQYKSTKRHPSILIEESLTVIDQLDGNYNDPSPLDHRLLTSGPSSYDLFCNSTSDTERYYTAAGGDTMDELDATLVPDNVSYVPSTSTTSGKGDSISISSAETVDHYDDGRCKVIINNVDEIIVKVNDIKIISGSKDSLLDGNNYTNGQTGSMDSFQSFEEIENREETLFKTKTQWMAKSLTTLAPKYESDREECSIMSCLTNFTSSELLTGNNKISCESCTRIEAEEFSSKKVREGVKSNASKQLLILSPPAILTLQLKRFQHVGSNLQKVNKFVRFPLVLDLAPFVSSISVGLNNINPKQSQLLYSLYGIVQHSGRLDNGHYVAYVRTRAIDHTRLMKKFLNVKPSSGYEVDQLIEEMMLKEDSLKRFKPEPFKTMDIKSVTEEVKTGRWYYVSDTHVSEVNIDKVMKAQAYLLFYERIL